MRNLILSALLLASAFETAMGAVEGQWTYIIENGGASITASTATGAVTIPSVLGGYAVKQVGDKFVSLKPIFSLASASQNTSVITVVIPSSVTSIRNGAFSYCSALTSITIPSSVTSIPSFAFRYCSALTSITIPDKVTSIGESAFSNCVRLTSITIPDGVTGINGETFMNCSSLTSITIPDRVTFIGVNAFANCSSLTSITVPDGVTYIGSYAFSACTKLVTAYLPARFSGTYPDFSLTAAQVYFGTTATLTASCNSSEGTILVNPNKSAYDIGESAEVTATPKAGYLFSNWSGASTATTSSITLTMDSDKIVTATFIQDGGDNDGDSLTNYRESVTFGTNPNVAETTSPVAGLYLATQMQAMAIGDLVITKNANGSFTLNYDIEQSADLQVWTRYQALSQTLTGLPIDKAFVRIKAKQ